MRPIFFAVGTVVLALAASLWPTAASSGKGVRVGGARVVVTRPPARVGSVHYAVRPAPVVVAPARVVPAVRVGAVRAEHYAVEAPRGIYRNPYRDDYFRRFRPGYRPFILNGAQYYGYDILPLGYQQVVLNGIVYYLLDGVYYQPYIYGGQTVYLVVPPP